MLNKHINATQEGKFLENSIINQSKFRQIKTIVTSLLIISGVQGIDSSKVLAFGIIPIDAVSTSLISSEYFGLGESYDTFQVNVSNEPESDPMAKLVGFTLSFTPIGSPPSPPFPQIFPEGWPYLSDYYNTSLKTPLGWQMIEISQISHYFCSSHCATILIPTLTFQAIDPRAGISPGTSLGGFGVAYDTGCGIYCHRLERSVIAVSSVPEPVTILGAVIALGFGITFKWKYSKTHSNNP